MDQIENDLINATITAIHNQHAAITLPAQQSQPINRLSMKQLALITKRLQAQVDTTNYIDYTVLSQLTLEPNESYDLTNLAHEYPTLLVQLESDETRTQSQGTPYWERLMNEPLADYKLFEQYRDEEPHNRAIYKLANQTNQTPEHLHNLKDLNHWQDRAATFDLYKSTIKEKVRSYEIELMETKHKKQADRIFDKVTTYFENLDDAFLKPEVALQWLNSAVKLNRLSLGVAPDKAACELKQNEQQTQQLTQIEIKTGTNNNFGNQQNEQQAQQAKLQDILAVLQKAGSLNAKVTARDIEPIVEQQAPMVSNVIEMRRSE